MTKSAKILLFTSAFATFATEVFGPIYAIFVRKIGGDVLEASGAYATFAILSGVFIFTVGRSKFFLNHLRGMVVLGFVFLTLSRVGYLFVNNPWELFIVQIFLGIAVGILEPSWDGIYSAGLDEGSAASQWSAWAGMRDIITGVAALAGGFIVAYYSFTVLFIVMVAFDLIALLISLKLFKN